MSSQKFRLNYPNIPILAVGFTRSNSFIGGAIRFIRGGFKAVGDKSFCNHAFLVTIDHNQKFATEETPQGLMELSLEQYVKSSNRIVAMYYWNGWDIDGKQEAAMTYLAEVRRRMMESSRYDFIGLLKFVPVLRRFVKFDKKRQFCSENCASVLKKFGASFIDKTELAPDQLLKIMQDNCLDSTECVLGYYLS